MIAVKTWLRVVLLTGAQLAAQERPARPALPAGAVTVRGIVVAAETGQPLPFSIVELVPVVPQTFTTQGGEFAFPGVAPGRYHLLARQIGYTPLDTLLVVRPDTAPVLRIALAHLAIRLPALTATPLACLAPGAPDPAAAPELAAVFGQVLENARRLILLSASQPFIFRSERAFTSFDRQGRFEPGRTDTLTQESRREWLYRPGKVIDWGTGSLRYERVVRLPALGDFADSTFVRAHCFQLAGSDTLLGGTYIRLDFSPASTLRSSGVEGSAYLDTATYQIRYTVIGLTKPGRAMSGVQAMVTTTRFREIIPGIILHDWLRAVTTYTASSGATPGRRIEEQRLLTVSFVRPLSPAP